MPPAHPPSTPIVATLANSAATTDLKILLGTLALWNTPAPTVYLFCDKAVADMLPSLKYPGRLIFREDLNPYTSVQRAYMEATPGRRYATRWMDFMTEKIRLLDWVFEAEPHAAESGVLFCDADICFCAPLPSFNGASSLALSPHEIRAADEAKFGRYNGGMLWIRDQALLRVWETACRSSRFYEQSALEDVAAAATATTATTAAAVIPRTHNYGWWRLFQGERSPADLQAEWSIHRTKAPNSSGILVDGMPLGSVHTHFGETRDRATVAFNQFVIGFLKRLAPSHSPAKRLLGILAAAPATKQN